MYPSCFCLREKKKNTNDENTLLKARRKKKRERERERERERDREKELDHPKRVNLKEGPPHKISNLLVLDPRRERERERERSHQNQSLVRTVYFPDRMTTCKRLLMPSCVFFDESFDILKRLTRI